MNVEVHSRRSYAILTAVVASLGLALGCGKPESAGIGQPFGDFEIARLDGGKWKLSDHRGRPVVINYWATWCPPCVEETAGLVEVAEKRKDIRLVGISIDDNPDAVKRFVEKHRIPYPVLLPKKGDPVTGRITGVPETYILDAEGRLVDAIIGPISARDLEARIDFSDAGSLRSAGSGR
jgi:peroxiredoxin